jgi:hypothetical protein
MPVRRLLLATIACGAGLFLLTACHPTCTESELQAPVNLNPNSDAAVLDPSVLASFTWGYPTSSCDPDFFEMYVWTGLEPTSPGMTGRVNYDAEVSPGAWHLTWPVPLQPGNTYYWRQAACLEMGPGTDPCGPSALGHFFTGPECSPSDVMQPVNLISPADDVTIAATDDVTFAWDDPTPCLVSYLFWIQISESPDFSTYLRRIPILQSVYTLAGDEIPLEDCHRYYWRIQTDPAGTPEEPFSAVRSFYVESPGALCPMELAPGPVLTVVPQAPVPPSQPEATLPVAPGLRAPKDTNCRSGPSSLYKIDDTLFAGVLATIQGRNADGSWVQILSPNLRRLCWVWIGQPGMEVQGDLNPLPVIRVAPPPEPEPSKTPVNCSQYDQKTCLTISACTWKESAVAAGKCVER